MAAEVLTDVSFVRGALGRGLGGCCTDDDDSFAELVEGRLEEGCRLVLEEAGCAGEDDDNDAPLVDCFFLFLTFSFLFWLSKSLLLLVVVLLLVLVLLVVEILLLLPPKRKNELNGDGSTP